ncbi:MAG: SDR family NAD(P)-dependent oxidoreductase [Myxococcales bacterium]|nr:SDR family oxidoreductase [Myxococcales bacterium]
MMKKALTFAAGAASAAILARWLSPAADLHGAVVLVTGGSRGLGLVLCRELARRGARIVLCARDEEEVLRARRDLESRGAEVLALVCDVRIPAAAERLVEQAVARFGGLDVVVNNAGIIQVGPHETMSLNDFQKAMATNFWGAVHVTLPALPHLRRSSVRRVVNIVSIGGAISVPHLLPYSCAKFALRGFSEGLGAELAGDRIRVTTVMPWLMRTGSFVNALFKGKREEELAWFALGSTMPVVSVAAERAARRIVRACEHGEPFLTLGIQAKALRIAHALAPGLATRILGLVNSLLPDAGGAGPADPAEPGWQHRSPVNEPAIRAAGDRAARDNNELGFVPA